MEPGLVGVKSSARVAALRASRLLEQGPERSFDRITRLASALLATPFSFLTVVDEVRTVLKGAPDSAALCGPDGRFEVPARETPCQLVVDTGRELVVGDIADDDRLRDLGQVRALGAVAWVGVPIVDPDGHVLGELCACDTRVRAWTAEDLEALRTLAATVDDSIALRLAAQSLQVYAAEAGELAEILQQSLLPLHAPRIAGLEIATRFAPGGTGTEVLGDFYDVVPIDGGVGVVIGDVCGKGAVAARTTAMARSAVRTAAHSEADPSAILHIVNEVLLEWFGPRRSFVTATYAALHRRGSSWEVVIAGAGHPPGFVRRADGRVEELSGGGRALGLTAELPVELDTLLLEAGDALVLYTDGVTEARDPHGVQLDEPGVARALADSSTDLGSDVGQLAQALVDAALTHAGHTNTDDLAVVAVRAR